MWFETWPAVLRIVLVGAASYVTLVILLRLVGKRVLAKLNAFDLVVTVALGSILASAVLSQDVRYVDAVSGMVLLIGLQWLVGPRDRLAATGAMVRECRTDPRGPTRGGPRIGSGTGAAHPG